MDPISRPELESLLTPDRGPCVSIFMPTVRAGAETQQNPIRFKNLVREAEGRLAERGVEKGEAAEVLAPAARLIDDHDFWQHQDAGLAVFLAPGFERRYRLPIEVKELAAVEDRFHVKPLLSLLDGDGAFFILALSKGRVRLFEGGRFRVREVDLDGVPTSLEEALGHELTESHLQFHTGTAATRGGRGDRSAVFHGQGAGEEDEKAEIKRYFDILDRGLRERLNDHRAPLVLAGVDYLLPIFREATGYPHLVEGGVHGNPDDLRPEELHEKAWELVEPHFAATRETDAERFHERVGTGRASGRLGEVVPAAFDGRVDTLFVARGVHRWGSFDRAERQLRLDDEPGPGSEDLLDTAAVQTYLNGGTVHAVDPEEVPGDEPLAAVFRY